MSFNSFEFFLFFPIVLILLGLVRKNEWRHWILLIASYYFYMCWMPIFALLIGFVTLVNYLFAIGISKNENRAKMYLLASVFINFGILGFFKYYYFFCDNANPLLLWSGFQFPWLDIILPVGISFYTFQAQSYTLDVYYDVIPPEKNLKRFALYVSFFPQLVAGPIVKAREFLPQLQQTRKLFKSEDIYLGLKAIVIGLFLKMVIADNLAYYTFAMREIGFEARSSLNILMLSYSFMVQVYCDFAGYSSIAIGCAQLMGYRLPVNFNYPLLSIGIAELWQRWHISLSSWFRDYVFNCFMYDTKWFRKRIYVSIMLTMLLTGVWHGASWNFVIFGFLQGFYYWVELGLKSLFKNYIPGLLTKVFLWFVTIHAFCFSCIFFGIPDFSKATKYIKALLWLNWDKPILWGRLGDMGFYLSWIVAYYLLFMLRKKFENTWLSSRWFEMSLLSILVLAVVNLWGDAVGFIYFQF